MRWWKQFWCSLHGHGEFEEIQRLSVLAHVRCAKCGAEYCHNVWEGGFIPWNETAEVFFAKRLASEEANTGG